ncbi:MAG: hypothetical protein Q9165_005126 [Trypethelium subeluteriae]
MGLGHETETPYYTLAEGQPRSSNVTSEQLRTNGGGGGFVLLTSTQLLETLAHFSRERIPERTVHAKASGARGYFEVTDDISDLTDAEFLNTIGNNTEALVRIATTGPERGSADTVRDFRGFAVKLKTKEGNQDFVMNNQPVFFVRDPVKFPSLNRSHKRNAATNSSDQDMFWDFHVHNQESIHALMFLFGDRGLPSSVRHTNAYTGNTYKLTKADGTYHYARIHFLTNQGIEYLSNAEGARLAGTQPDWHMLDLQEAIKSRNYPSWNLCVQTIHPSALSDASIDVFDMTKVWPHQQYPLRKVGRLVLNRNPSNWFAEIEQAAFSPSNMVRGIEPSPDPMLQARMFAYPDAARYRLGINYQFLPTNAAKCEVYCPTERDGKMNFTSNYEGDPNYTGTGIKPLSFVASDLKPAPGRSPGGNAVHTFDRTEAGVPVSFASEVTDKDFEQATALWHLMGKQEGAQDRLVNNASAHISGVKTKWIRDKVYAMFGKVDKSLGEKIQAVTEKKIEHNHEHPHKTAWH